MRFIILMLLTQSLFSQTEVDVVATVYHAKSNQCNSEYWKTASNKTIDTLNPIKHRWIAISRDLESRYGLRFGDKVLISGTENFDGIWTVQDRMNKRWTNKIDFLVGTEIKFGKWNLKILIDDKIGMDTVKKE